MIPGIEILKPQEDWDVVLKRHITLLHSKSGQHKTTLSISPTLYRVVTRVNYMTVLLWVEWRNEAIKTRPELKLEEIKKPNWLTFIKSYRRDQEALIKTNL